MDAGEQWPYWRQARKCRFLGFWRCCAFSRSLSRCSSWPGFPRSLFVPLSLAVAFAMAASYLLSSSLVPVLSTWILREHAPEVEERPSLLHCVRDRLGRILERLTAIRWLTISAYVLSSLLVIALLGPFLGREIFPRVSAGQLLLRFRAPIGTRVETTERLT